MIDDRKLKEVDYELAKAIEDETRRQQEHIELIAVKTTYLRLF